MSAPGHPPQESMGSPGSTRVWGKGWGQDSGDRRVTEKEQVRREIETQTPGCQEGTGSSGRLWPQRCVLRRG